VAAAAHHEQVSAVRGVQRWEQERNIDRQAWLAAGKQAIIGLPIPERFGGAGTDDFRYRCGSSR
jgi:acyl-CoA dehydrogenase